MGKGSNNFPSSPLRGDTKMTGIEMFESYLHKGDVFVWRRYIESNPIICEIVDMKPGESHIGCDTTVYLRGQWKYDYGTLAKLIENTAPLYKVIEDYSKGEWRK